MSASAVRMGRAFVEIGADPAKLFKSLQQANARIGKFAAGLRSVGTQVMAAGTAMAAPLALASRQFVSFDDAIRATAAVSGATGADLQALNDRARQLGESTSFTAVQVANLMTELGRAGFKPDEINAMTGAVLNLARATETDATLASGIMAATLRQFGLGATDAARAADVLTMAANATFNTVEGLGESLKYAGPVAQSLGMSLEDTLAILGVLGNVGIQGSEAGTALRRLSVIAAGAGDDLQRIFGVSNTDAAGQMKPLVQVLDEINTVTANMPVAERTAKMAEAFGLLGITSANVLSQTAGGVTDLAAKLLQAEGTAAKTAAQMDAGLGGSFRIALSAVEGLAIAIGDALAPSMQAATQQVTEIVGGMTQFVKQNQGLFVAMAQGVAAFLAAGAGIYVLGAAFGVASAAAGIVLPLFGAIVTTTVAMGVGFVGLIVKIATLKTAMVAAAAVSAAAWTAANLPFIALAAGAAVIGLALFSVADGFGLIRSTVDGMVSSLATAAQSFLTIRDVGVMAFGEIMASMKAGDMAGALQVGMQGLMTVFTIGSSAFLNAVDEWGVNLVNAFDFYISQIPFLRFLGPDTYTFSVFGDSTGGDTPDSRADSRFADFDARSESRRTASRDAIANFSSMIGVRQNNREAMSNINAALAGPGPLRTFAGPAPGSFQADIAALGGGQPGEFDQWITDMQARQQREAQMLAAQRQMQAEASSQAEVAGTFSAAAISGMGVGSSLQQQMADYARRTADAVEKISEDGVLAAQT